MNDHDEEKTTERNLFVRSGKSEAELELGVLYSVEASRGLSATAELLVQCLPVIIFIATDGCRGSRSFHYRVS